MFEKISNYVNKYRLRVKMLIINALMTIIPLIIMGNITYYIFYKNEMENVSDSLNILFNQVNSRLEEYFNNIDLLTRGMFYNVSLQKFLVGESNIISNDSDKNQWMIYKSLSDYFNNFIEVNKSIKGICFIDLKNESYYNQTFSLDENMLNFIKNFDKDKLKTGRIFFSGTFKENGKLKDEYLAIRIIRSLQSTGYFDDIAVGALVLDRNILNKIINDDNLSKKMDILILDENNEIIASTNPQKNYNLNNVLLNNTANFYDINGVSYFIKFSSLNKEEWKLVAVVPKQQLLKQGNVILYTILLIITAIFPIVVIISLMLNIAITNPIIKLANTFDKVAAGDFNTKLSFKKRNEITVIADNFNNMIREIKSLTENNLFAQQKLYETEMIKKQFELNGLLTQINSHFLYNTLNCVRGMALKNVKSEIISIIENLVSFFRYNVNSKSLVAFKEEVLHLEAYLAIQKIRFPNKFVTVFDIDENLQDSEILKLTLQPLVENSVFHGLEQRCKKGIIKIRAYMEKDNIIVKILDNGIGIENDVLLKIRDDLSQVKVTYQEEKEKRSIGIINIQKRIQLYYGSSYGLQVKSWKGIGTVVILTIPCRKGVIKDV